MSLDEHTSQRIHAYHDGELSALGALRVRLRLAFDASARAELDAVRGLGEALRHHAADTAPGADLDLWSTLRHELPRAPRSVPVVMPAPSWRLDLPQWVGAGLATAMAGFVLALSLDAGDAPHVGSVRWLDAGERAAMVLRDDQEATIVWVIDAVQGLGGDLGNP